MKKITLLLFALALLSHLHGQGFSVSGMLIDSVDNQPLPGAHVSLMRLADSTTHAVVTEESGRFLLERLRRGRYELKISFLGYHPLRKPVLIREGRVDLGSLRLEQEAQQLEQVQVTEELLPAQQIGDTTQFNAGAFKTNPDASAEDLIRKLPGVVVDGGKVQAQGEDVKEVLVDGRPFFGNDPTAALRSLPAEVIDKIQVFDKQSEQSQFTGFDDGETTKTINIITRQNMRNGQFGKMFAGYGTDDRYQAGGNVNFFSGDSRLSVIAQSNNINQQNFASEDLLGVVASQQGDRRGGGSRGRGGGRGRGGSNVRDFLVNEQGGISRTNAIGLNYSDKWGEKIEVTGSYFFNQSDNDAVTILSQDYFTSSEFNQLYKENSETSSKNLNHRFNLRLEYEIDEHNSILFRPRFSLQKNKGLENTFGRTLAGNALLNQTDYNFDADLTALDFSNNILFRHRFAKRGRTFSISLNSGYNKNTGESFLLSENIFYEEIFTDTLHTDQFADLITDGWSLSSNVSYTEPLGKSGMLQFNYSASFQQNESKKETLDFSENTQDYSDLNPVLSNTFNSDYMTHQAGTGYRLRGEKYMLNTRVSFQYSTLDNQQIFPIPDQLDRTFYNILPSAFLRYNFSRSQNLRAGYRPRTSPPSIDQLQEVIDNTNSLQLRTGNPGLKQNYQHNLFARYSSTNTEKSTVFYILLAGGYTDNYIANSTFIARQDTLIREGVLLQRGAQLIRPVNLDGYWNARSFITYGLPLRLIKSNLNFNLSANYTRQPGMTNEELNYANNTALGLGLVLSSSISEKVDFTLSSRSRYNLVRNTLNTTLNDEYFNQATELGFNFIFGNGFVFRTDLTHLLYTGLSEGFDQNYWLWNAAFGKKFLKDQRGELRLSVFDLLKQNTSVTRNVTEAYIEDVQTGVLQQYFMLTFTYKLRNFGQAPAPQPEEDRRRFGPPGERRW